MQISGIYKIQSIIKPERVYIGSAVGFNHRRSVHLSLLRQNRHHTIKLQRHYNKYGERDLVFTVLAECLKGDLIKTEQYFIDIFKPYFNSSPTAGSNIGVVYSDERNRRLSLSRKGKKQSPETIKKRANAMRGKRRSQETRDKMSKSRMGTSPSKETKLKFKNNMLLLWSNPIYRNNMIESHNGKKQTKETIDKRNLKIYKPVLQLDIDNNILKEWGGASLANTKIPLAGHITDCCRGQRETSGGFKWRYKDVV